MKLNASLISAHYEGLEFNIYEASPFHKKGIVADKSNLSNKSHQYNSYIYSSNFFV